MSEPDPTTSLETQSDRFPCGQCGAELEYEPGTTTLTCEYCGHANEIEVEQATIQELDFRAHLAELQEQSSDVVEVDTARCGSCGAEVTRPEHAEAFQCPFCGSDIIAASTNARLIKPKSLLPFHVARDAARTSFRNWLKKLWFAPGDLKKYAHQDSKLDGIYVPFWTYDARTTSHYTGQRGKHYYVTQTYTVTVNGKRQTRTRRVRRTRWYPASGTVLNVFDDILICASRSLPEKHLEKLEPWDLPNLVPFADEYLAGFRAERYQVELDEGFAQAEPIMEEQIRHTVRKDIGGDEQRIHTLRVHHDDISFKHILLPVWISAYRYRDKVYRILINARTGEVQGERPWSTWKIALAVVAGLVVIGVIAAIAIMSR
jgi:predicted RNA-binding Zn-ribbon protein involved in translation (DUF1610 family)